MTAEEIVRHYRQAKSKRDDIQVLAELNGVKIEDIKEILIKAGQLDSGGRVKRKPGQPETRAERDDIIRGMLAEGHTWRETAEAACCSEPTVAVVAKRMRMEKDSLQKKKELKDARDKRDARIRELLMEGYTQKEVCKAVGCGSNLVSAIRQLLLEEQAKGDQGKIVPKMRSRSCSKRVFTIILNVPENADLNEKAAALEKCRKIIKAEQQ
jgi:DNA invertase Pin-like site-specific DNA recombinase